MFRQDQAEVLELVRLVAQFALPEVPNDAGIGCEQQQDQECRAGVNEPQGNARVHAILPNAAPFRPVGVSE